MHYCILYHGLVLFSLSVIISHFYALASFFCVNFSSKNWIIFVTLYPNAAIYTLTRALTCNNQPGILISCVPNLYILYATIRINFNWSIWWLLSTRNCIIQKWKYVGYSWRVVWTTIKLWLIYVIIIIITIIIYLSWSWATCWPVPVSRVQKPLQRSALVPFPSLGVVFHYPG
jgi:hypothetical protein